MIIDYDTIVVIDAIINVNPLRAGTELFRFN